MRICLDAGEHKALGMLPLTEMLLSAWASPKNHISQDPLSLSQINSSIRKSPYST